MKTKEIGGSVERSKGDHKEDKDRQRNGGEVFQAKQ
jgi:hypothetical protein